MYGPNMRRLRAETSAWLVVGLVALVALSGWLVG